MNTSNKSIDWGKTSWDYHTYRAGPPASFYQKLLELGIGEKGQKILDIGTGTGILARQFAMQGAEVAASDISVEQINLAKEAAKRENLQITFKVAPAEHTPFDNQSFDVITANQCWLYFDMPKTVAEVKRLLKHAGILLISSYHWLPRQSSIAKKTEDLIVKYNPNWPEYNWEGIIEPQPIWVKQYFHMKNWFCYDEEILFTHEQWRGRIRASRPIGATLSKDEVQLFDAEHEQILQKTTKNEFLIPHRIYGRLLVPL